MTALWAVVPAAGSGSRMALQQPKQFVDVCGRSILEWSIDALLTEARITQCMVALPEGSPRQVQGERLAFCQGGASRAESVAAGIDALGAPAEDWVLVHDAARPCLPTDDLSRLIDAVLDAQHGGLLAQPLTDTLKRGSQTNRSLETIARDGLWRAQTPQMFRIGELRSALKAAEDADYVVTDEASAMERAGHEVLLVEGSSVNLKVTYPDDLKIAALWLSERKSSEAAKRAVSDVGNQTSGSREYTRCE